MTMAALTPIDRPSLSGLEQTSSRESKNAEQLKSLAAQFESVLLGQMLKQMRDSMFDEKDDAAKSTGFSGGPLIDQIYTELSLALGRSGGVGLAQALGPALMRQSEALRPGGLDLTIDLPAQPATPGLNVGSGSGYGWRRDPIQGDMRLHTGADIPMPVGTGVQSAQAGQVQSVGVVPGYGLTVVVAHGGGVATRYAHLSEATAKVGDAVTRGQVIALSGTSGRSTGPHLHFEVLDAGKPVDPSAMLVVRERS
jgi:murein DD-endopeptidase MepM/ murein hydrolase activator NlpD